MYFCCDLRSTRRWHFGSEWESSCSWTGVCVCGSSEQPGWQRSSSIPLWTVVELVRFQVATIGTKSKSEEDKKKACFQFGSRSNRWRFKARWTNLQTFCSKPMQRIATKNMVFYDLLIDLLTIDTKNFGQPRFCCSVISCILRSLKQTETLELCKWNDIGFEFLLLPCSFLFPCSKTSHKYYVWIHVCTCVNLTWGCNDDFSVPPSSSVKDIF